MQFATNVLDAADFRQNWMTWGIIPWLRSIVAVFNMHCGVMVLQICHCVPMQQTRAPPR